MQHTPRLSAISDAEWTPSQTLNCLLRCSAGDATGLLLIHGLGSLQKNKVLLPHWQDFSSTAVTRSVSSNKNVCVCVEKPGECREQSLHGESVRSSLDLHWDTVEQPLKITAAVAE